MGKALAVLGTASDVGKSVLAAGLCRLWAREGRRVAPFKAQNMSLNSYVTGCGGEIGRAQAVQARACGIEPTVDMNPILLKPESDTRAQVILQGRAVVSQEAARYYEEQTQLWTAVTESYGRLAAAHEIIVIEGAGSAAEVNLRDRDLVNWRMVHYADAQVVLVADIDRGGVFAQVVGTLDLLRPNERARVKGVVINKFRGDRTLFDDGVRFLESRTGVPVLGVIPFLPGCRFEEEDSLPERARRRARYRAETVNIAVILLPRMSNATDFLVLESEPDVVLRYVQSADELAEADVVMIPGTKNTMADLAYLRAQNFPPVFTRHVQVGRELIGLCGGYQMLGRMLSDPHGIEEGRAVAGLGFLDVSTSWERHKVCRRVAGVVADLDGLNGHAVVGYEIHAGRTASQAVPALLVAPEGANPEANGLAGSEPEGAVGVGGRVWGTSVHGVFDAPAFRSAWLQRVRSRKGLPPRECEGACSASAMLDVTLTRWADHLDGHLDRARLERGLFSEELL